ncbi:DsbA family protein [Brevundimonas sp.]|uniref:DsbA family protein n=1 Tax=Brevundimonas sp. TaxID=1871086 RepID=UPI001D66DE21|nr:DsbA family protein [Brevundimonas sp.]MBA4000724.1 disulfide bond formation protein DsbA [Brevundimonas sp.]
MTDDADRPATPSSDRAGWIRDPRLGLAALGVSVVALGVSALPWLTGGDFDGRVRAYLLSHPEVLEEMLQARQVQQQAAGTEAINAAISSDPSLIAHDPRDPAVGPAPGQAAVTVIEFFDYRCPGCKSVAPGLLALVQANPDVRFVFKEWPILDRPGDETSNYAARAALAAHEQGRYLEVHQALMAEPALDVAAVDEVLQEAGVDMNAARAFITSQAAEGHVGDIHEAARQMNLQGTPTFIVNGRATDGIDPRVVAGAIAAARGG